jgi:hypothetical protein
MQVSLTLASRNPKTGPIPVSTTTKASCPDCAMKAVCYAEGGHVAMQWRKVTAGVAGYVWADFVAQVAKLGAGMLWRHNQAGDLPGEGNAIDTAALAQLVTANQGKRGFTYTHKPVLDNVANAEAVRAANAGGVHDQSFGQHFGACRCIGGARYWSGCCCAGCGRRRACRHCDSCRAAGRDVPCHVSEGCRLHDV